MLTCHAATVISIFQAIILAPQLSASGDELRRREGQHGQDGHPGGTVLDISTLDMMAQEGRYRGWPTRRDRAIAYRTTIERMMMVWCVCLWDTQFACTRLGDLPLLASDADAF